VIFRGTFLECATGSARCRRPRLNQMQYTVARMAQAFRLLIDIRRAHRMTANEKKVLPFPRIPCVPLRLAVQKSSGHSSFESACSSKPYIEGIDGPHRGRSGRTCAFRTTTSTRTSSPRRTSAPRGPSGAVTARASPASAWHNCPFLPTAKEVDSSSSTHFAHLSLANKPPPGGRARKISTLSLWSCKNFRAPLRAAPERDSPWAPSVFCARNSASEQSIDIREFRVSAPAACGNRAHTSIRRIENDARPGRDTAAGQFVVLVEPRTQR